MEEHMLHARTLLTRDGIAIAEVACRDAAGRGEAGEHTGAPTLVFVRRGVFRRSADGGDAVLDPTAAYCVNRGEEER
jgi:hypothetical protein